MRIAVTYENGQIFEYFGSSEQFKIYNAIDKWEDIQKYTIVRIDKKTFLSKHSKRNWNCINWPQSPLSLVANG